MPWGVKDVMEQHMELTSCARIPYYGCQCCRTRLWLGTLGRGSSVVERGSHNP